MRAVIEKNTAADQRLILICSDPKHSIRKRVKQFLEKALAQHISRADCRRMLFVEVIKRAKFFSPDQPGDNILFFSVSDCCPGFSGNARQSSSNVSGSVRIRVAFSVHPSPISSVKKSDRTAAASGICSGRIWSGFHFEAIQMRWGDLK